MALAEEGALLLLVISAAAESFPHSQGSALASQLLQVRAQSARLLVCSIPPFHLHTWGSSRRRSFHLSPQPLPKPSHSPRPPRIRRNPNQATLAFNLPPAASAAHIVALHKLTSAGDTDSVGAPDAWCRRAYAAAHDLLHQYVSGSFGGAGAGCAQQQLARLQRRAAAAIFAVGELALLRVARPPAGVTVLLQALTAPRLLPGMMAAALEGAAAEPSASSQQQDDAAERAERADEDEEGGEAEENAREVPSSLQGHAWISLGKVCLVEEALAKKLVPLFIQVRARSASSGAH